MLANVNRLTGQKNIERVKKEGKLFQRKLFGISVLKRKDKGPSRFVFVVSTKINKNANQRNRIKRAMRESVRYSMTQTKKGYDVMFLAKKNISNKLTDEIMREVTISLKAIGLGK